MKTDAAKAQISVRLQRAALRPARARFTRASGNWATTAVPGGMAPRRKPGASICTRLTKSPAQWKPTASRSSRSWTGARWSGLVGGHHQHHFVHERGATVVAQPASGWAAGASTTTTSACFLSAVQ